MKKFYSFFVCSLLVVLILATGCQKEETPEIEVLTPTKKRRRLFQSKQDILRAYIADTVLDKPKWKDGKKGDS